MLGPAFAIDQSAASKIQSIPQQDGIKSPQEITSPESDFLRPPDLRRPIWNLAHMVNSIKELDYRLGKGANAVEVDVTFGREGDPLFTYHGPPCDCWRHCHQQEEFNEYLRYVRQIALEEVDGIGQNLTILFLDLKLDPLDHKRKARAGAELAKSLVANVFSQKTEYNLGDRLDDFSVKVPFNSTEEGSSNKLTVILSVNHVTDIELVNNFVHQMDTINASHLMANIGFDVGMNDDLEAIDLMWKRFKGVNKPLNLWQGDGFTNCISPFYNLERLSRALVKRDAATGYPKKVYQWTIDLHDRMREALKMGVDGVMTNHPERLLTVLREPDVARDFRLATRQDDPFKKIIHRSSGETARYQRSTSQSSGGFFGSFWDILTSWFTYMKEIPYLSLPTTSRLMPQFIRRQKPPTPEVKKRSASLTIPTSTSASPSTSSTTTTTTTTFAPQTNSTGASETTTLATSTLPTESGSNNETATTTVASESSQQPPYEPKWYTSLASNLLVSAVKIALPEKR